MCQQSSILDVLCTSKSLTSSVHHYVKDGISDHLAIFFTTTFLVKNSCRVKCLKIRKLGKINKTEFMSDIANSELIKAPYKTASLLSHQYFHTLRNLLDKHAPVHERKIPHDNKGFINSEILAEKRRKCKLEREWRSCDLDPIPTSMVLDCISVLLTPITNIVNYSLQEGSFPKRPYLVGQ